MHTNDPLARIFVITYGGPQNKQKYVQLLVGERNRLGQEIQQNFNNLTLSLINTHSVLYQVVIDSILTTTVHPREC